MENIQIEKAKEVLRKAGYYVDNLWHIDDVTSKLDDYIIPEGEELDEYDKQNILDSILTSDFTVSNINESIEYELGFRFKSKEEEEE